MSSDSFVGEGLNPTPYREMKEENERLRAALLDIRNTVHLDCENVHHTKRDQHHAVSDCPVVRRISTAIDAALAQGEKP